MTTPTAGPEEFMHRIRAALDRSRRDATEPPPAVDHKVVRTVGPSEDLAAVFERRANEAGLRVHRTNAEALPGRIAGLAAELGIKTIAAGAIPLVPEAALAASLDAAGIGLVPWTAAAGLVGMYDADAGLTGVQAAIAESGTLVCTTGPGRPRGLSLVPPIHIAVVLASQIVPDLVDVMDHPAGAPPSNIILITGPSKTADIEGVLITGVHGPREVHAVLVQDA
jgi:L-lactate dehydrogenase complex protein LldG